MDLREVSKKETKQKVAGLDPHSRVANLIPVLGIQPAREVIGNRFVSALRKVSGNWKSLENLASYLGRPKTIFHWLALRISQIRW
jgi:hypothetical protein